MAAAVAAAVASSAGMAAAAVASAAVTAAAVASAAAAAAEFTGSSSTAAAAQGCSTDNHALGWAPACLCDNTSTRLACAHLHAFVTIPPTQEALAMLH